MNIKEAFKPDLKDREHGYLDITFTKARLMMILYSIQLKKKQCPKLWTTLRS